MGIPLYGAAQNARAKIEQTKRLTPDQHLKRITYTNDVVDACTTKWQAVTASFVGAEDVSLDEMLRSIFPAPEPTMGT